MSGPAERRAYARAKAAEKKAALDRKQQRQQEAEKAELAAEWDEYDDPALYEWPYLRSDEPR
jgi:hypothetical protein